MGILRKIVNKLSLNRKYASLGDEDIAEWLGVSSTRKKSLSEVTYFTCLKMLSETIGKLPIKYYQEVKGKGKIRAEPNRAMYLASVRPNPFMTPSTFWATVEINTEHYGNGYVWMRRNTELKKYGGTYEHIDWWVMPSKDVTILIDDTGIFGGTGNIYYRYIDSTTAKEYIFDQNEVMHFKTWLSFDGITGKSVQEILEHTVSGAYTSQKFMNNLYEKGLSASMAIQYMGELDEAKRKALQRKYDKRFSGPENAGRVIPVPPGMTITPLNISLTDAQFFELKKYSALQIAGAFGIKPNQINNYEKSSYANSETQQLAFLVDTMSFRLKAYEEEMNYKALTEQEISEGKYFKFNEKAILRTDSKTQMNNLTSGIDKGIYTPNEARDYLDMPHVEGGDTPVVNGTYIPLTEVGKQYKKKE